MTGPTMHTLFDGSESALIPDFSLPPWSFRVCDSDPTVYQVLDADGVVIAFPRRGTAGRSERRMLEKNARLITAAPLMLKALGGMLDQFNFPSAERDAEESEAIRAAIAAIAKSIGLQS